MLVSPVVAMHMANELLSVPVALLTLLLGGACVGVAAAVARRRIDSDMFPLMGVIGAFVFAAQMINFTLPGMPGTSGHLIGAVLLAVVLGPAAGILVIAAVLVIQCLIFQDGGLLALGCNIINMGVVPSLVGWGLYRLLLGPGATAPRWRQYVSAWAACVLGVTAGATLVPVEAALSGVLRIPVADFLTVMVGVHLIIGCIEGAVTFAVLAYLRRTRPALLGLKSGGPVGDRVGLKPVLVTLLMTALLLAGVVSWFASTRPDGLEWAWQTHQYGQTDTPVENASRVIASVDDWQTRWAPLGGYTVRPVSPGSAPAKTTPTSEAESVWPAVNGWRSLAGVVGTLLTLAAVYLAAMLVGRHKPAHPAD